MKKHKLKDRKICGFLEKAVTLCTINNICTLMGQFIEASQENLGFYDFNVLSEYRCKTFQSWVLIKTIGEAQQDSCNLS